LLPRESLTATTDRVVSRSRKPKDPAHEAFENFPLKLPHGDMPLELLLVAAISRVVLAGLDRSEAWFAIGIRRRHPGSPGSPA